MERETKLESDSGVPGNITCFCQHLFRHPRYHCQRRLAPHPAAPASLPAQASTLQSSVLFLILLAMELSFQQGALPEPQAGKATHLNRLLLPKARTKARGINFFWVC